MEPPGRFDKDYASRVAAACAKAIMEASLDPTTNTSVLRNAEVYSALLKVMATVVATSKEADTPAGVRSLAVDFAGHFVKHVAAAKAVMQVRGQGAFSILHPEDLQ